MVLEVEYDEVDGGYIVRGGIYNRRDAIRAAGGQWDPNRRRWYVPWQDARFPDEDALKRFITNIGFDCAARERTERERQGRAVSMLPRRKRDALRDLTRELEEELAEVVPGDTFSKTRVSGGRDWMVPDGVFIYSGPAREVNAAEKFCGTRLVCYKHDTGVVEAWSFNYD